METRNRFSRLAAIDEEEPNEDIPLHMLQKVTVADPNPARADHIQDQVTGGEFGALGREYERRAEANGGQSMEPARDMISQSSLHAPVASAVVNI